MDAKPSPAEGLEMLDNGFEDSSGEETSDVESLSVLNSCIAGPRGAQERNMQRSNERAVQAGSTNDLSSAETQQPQLLPPALLLASTEELLTSVRMCQDLPPDDDDQCAALLLACLFCHPLDCLLATVRGCNKWLCSSLFCCDPTTVQSVLNVARQCSLCGGQESCCCQCDCSICDLCLQATECLDLAMEISQMLYH